MNKKKSPAACKNNSKNSDKIIAKSQLVSTKLHKVTRPRNGKKQKPSKSRKGKKVAQDSRNDTLREKAYALKKLNLPDSEIETMLLDLNKKLCAPSLQKSEVQAIVKSVIEDASNSKGGFVPRLLRDMELWHDENGDPFATLTQGEHRENLRIGKRSTAFRRWISKKHYDVTGRVLKSSDLSEITSMLEGHAVYEGPCHKWFRRTAGLEGTIYLDLCDDEWRAVSIDTDGYRVVSEPPVKFRRANGMLSLPVPSQAKGTQLEELLRPYLNIHNEQWPLVAGWLIAALRPSGPYPILKLVGEGGSTKTTTARVLRSIVDPNKARSRAESRSTRDLMIAANNAWVICLDNLSVINPDLSDALCRLSTGGGFATRTLYTDEDETIFDAMRPSILTTIEEIGTRSDLLDRSLIIEIPPIKDKSRKTENMFWPDFERDLPKILGAVLDVMSAAIRRLPEIESRTGVELPRLADFHMWAEAGEVALGLKPGTFAEAYAANRETATQTVLETSSVIHALLNYLKEKGRLEGTATEVLETIGKLPANISLRDKPGWPKNSRGMSSILRRSAPHLREIGFVAEQKTRGSGNNKEKVWKIIKTEA